MKCNGNTISEHCGEGTDYMCLWGNSTLGSYLKG